MFFDRLNADKLLILSKFMDRFNAIPIKIPKEIEKLTLKCIGGYFPGGPVTKTQHPLDLIIIKSSTLVNSLLQWEISDIFL